MIEKPKKERRFLKALGRVGEILIQEVLIKIGSNLIKKIGGKKTLPSILFLLASFSLFAQYPNTGNKQRLGFQTTGDGLTWRGSISDTASIQPINNQNAWVILDTVNLEIYSFDFTSNVWNLVGGGSSAFAQPIDSLFFDTSVPTNNVDTAKMRWDSDLATVVLGLNDNVPNELGFKNFWLVKNQTGSTITKGSIVYANGTVGASGRITVAKFIANGSIDAKYLLGITAHDLTDGEDGYVISYGKIRQVNTDTFAAGAILYPSPTVAGVWTDVEPIAPNIDMSIGFCINSSSNNGTIAIRVASGYKLSELHDVAISSPIEKASLYYSGGLWRDTTAALLVSDTASMLANYATKAYADTTDRFYARQDFTNVSSSTLTWTQSDTLIPAGVNVVQVYRNGQILLPTQYTIPTSTSVVIAATSYKVGENYTVIFPRGGGAGSGGGSGSLTSISGGTGILVSPDPITTTGTVSADLSVLMELTDTSLLNLTSRLATKLNISDTAAMLSNYNTSINSKLNISDTLSMLAPYFRDADTSSLNLTSRFAFKLNATDTASLSNRINAKGTGTVTSVATGYGLSGGTITSTGTLVLDSAVVFSRIRDSIVDVAIGNDTIKILKQEYAPATTSVLTWTITPKFPIQLKAYILVFRNGQLLINDQYNLTDTNQITIVSNSFKVGANYTVVTVSGIGSVGTGTFPNPVYPEAGIAVSTGTTWTTSIPNNSSNWNIAFNDKINNAAFSGTTTKTLTLTQYDGGTLTAPFTDLQGIVAADTASMLTNYLRSGVAASTYLTQSNAASTYLPLTGGTLTGDLNAKYLNTFAKTTYIPFNAGIGEQSIFNVGTALRGGTVMVFPDSNLVSSSANIFLANSNVQGVEYSAMGSGMRNYSKQGGDNRRNSLAFYTSGIGSQNTNRLYIDYDGNVGINDDTPSYKLEVNGTFNATGNITEGGNNVLTNLDTASLSSRIDGKVSLTASESIGGTKTFNNLVNIGNQMTISGSVSGGNILLGKNTSNNGVADITLGTGLIISSNVLNATVIDTTSLSNRINLKYDKTGGTISGVVTMNDELNLSSGYLKRGYLSSGSSSVTVGDNDTWVRLANSVSVSLTLPSASSFSGREIHVLNVSNGSVISANTNVIDLTGNLGFAILSSGGGKWATLVSNGTYWQIMAGN